MKNEYDFILVTIHHKQFYKNNRFNFASCAKKDGLIYDIKKAGLLKDERKDIDNWCSWIYWF